MTTIDTNTLAVIILIFVGVGIAVVFFIFRNRRRPNDEPTSEELLDQAGVQPLPQKGRDIYKAIYNQLGLLSFGSFVPFITSLFLYIAYISHYLDFISFILLILVTAGPMVAGSAFAYVHIITSTAPKKVLFLIWNPRTPTQTGVSYYAFLKREQPPVEVRIRDVIAQLMERQKEVQKLRPTLYGEQ